MNKKLETELNVLLNFPKILEMEKTYDQRKVDNWKGEGVVIDTVEVVDYPESPFETGIKSEKFNSGNWVIVERYLTKEIAESGHKRWVQTVELSGLPDNLTDVNTGEVYTKMDE